MNGLEDRSGSSVTRPLKIAWIGSPSEGGGVGGFCLQLLQALNSSPVDLTVFSICEPEAFEFLFRNDRSIPRHFPIPLNWSWERWYSRNHLSVFLSSFWARRRAYSQLVKALVVEHSQRPFDVVLQFSQSEIFEAENLLESLPPFIIFPCVHAAGELQWHRSESDLALRSESRFKHWCIRAVLTRRARLQARTYKRVYGVIGMSRRFNELVRQDYGVDARDQSVVYQPLPSSASGVPSANRAPTDKIRVIFVGRISVRKGIEMLVELSHRIDDLADQVEIVVVGDRSFWSDYTGLLKDLNPAIVRVMGSLPHSRVLDEMLGSQILIVPSHYEPGGIVVAEGLAAGCVVIASDEVGSAEVIDLPICHKYPHADIQALEDVFRKAVKDVQDRGSELRELAASIAQQIFAPEITKSQLLSILHDAAGKRRIGKRLPEVQGAVGVEPEAMVGKANPVKS